MKKAKSRFNKPVMKNEVENKHTSYICKDINNDLPCPDVVIVNYGLSEEEQEEDAKKFLCLVATKHEVEQRKIDTGHTYWFLARQVVYSMLKTKPVKFDPFGEFGFNSSSGFFRYDGIMGRIVKKGQ